MRILVTNRYSASDGYGGYQPANTVCVEHCGEREHSTVVLNLPHFESETINLAGHKGAVVFRPDVTAIRQAVDDLRGRYPGVDVVDHSGVLSASTKQTTRYDR